MSIDRCQIRSIGKITDGEAMVGGAGTRALGGSDVEYAIDAGGAAGGGCAMGRGVGVREDHGATNRLTELARSPGRSGPERLLDILMIVVGGMNILAVGVSIQFF